VNSNNTYTRAVDYLDTILQGFIEAAELNQMSLPNIESGLEFAMKVLKSHQDYDGKNVS